MNDTTTLSLVLKDTHIGVPEITKEAFALRERAITIARKVQRVTTPDEQATAVTALQELKSIRTGMETTRKAVKAPVLDLGKAIDAKAADFIEDVMKQEGRLIGMVNHFQRKQLNEARESAAKAEREKAEAEQLQLKAQSEQDPDKRRALEAEAFDKQMEIEVSGGALTPVKTKGLAVRVRVNFKITDAIVFVQAYPEFFRWNADTEALKLDRLRVLDELNREDGRGVFHRTHFPEELGEPDRPEFVRPPGMEIFEDVKAHVR